MLNTRSQLLITIAALLIGVGLGVVGTMYVADGTVSNERAQADAAPVHPLVAQWRGSAQGIVSGITDTTLSIRNDEGEGLHALLSEGTDVKSTRIEAGAPTEVDASLSDIAVGDTVVVLLGNQDGHMKALEVNKLEVVEPAGAQEGPDAQE